MPTNLSIGYFLREVSDLAKQLEEICNNKFNFIATSVISARSKFFDPFSDLLLSNHGW